MYITGSTAIKYWFPDFPREPKDLDYFTRTREHKSTVHTEFLYNPIICREMEKRWSHTEYLSNVKGEVVGLLGSSGNLRNVDPELLLTNLMSHIFWQEDRIFNKHMYSIQFLLDKGVEYDKDLFYELYEFWPEIHGKNRRSDLSISSDEFFDNAINPNQSISHDELHYLILDEGEEPAYKQILVGEVLTSDELFEKLPHVEKIKICFEESVTMAFERYPKQLPPVRYLKQLRKMITGHLTMEESIFAIVNYKELVSLAAKISKEDYFNKVNAILRERGLNELI